MIVKLALEFLRQFLVTQKETAKIIQWQLVFGVIQTWVSTYSSTTFSYDFRQTTLASTSSEYNNAKSIVRL